MTIAIESLLFLLIGIVLAVVLTRAIGRSSGASAGNSGAPGIKIVRTVRTPEGHEETWLVVNEQVILAASNDGLRLAQYADEVEQLEAVAARLAKAMGITVEFSRRGAGGPDTGEGIPVRSLPTMDDEEAEERSQARRLKKDQGGA